MYIGTEFRQTQHVRTSSCGKSHPYFRKLTVVVLRCDACLEVFTRPKGSMSPSRLNNDVYHVCGCCDAKKFAQEKGVEGRKVWDMPVSSLKSIGLF